MTPDSKRTYSGVGLVLVGAVLQAAFLFLEQAWMIVLGMGVAAAGLWIYAQATGRKWYVVVAALIPFFGPLLGLAASDQGPAESKPPLVSWESLRTLGIFFILLGSLWTMSLHDTLASLGGLALVALGIACWIASSVAKRGMTRAAVAVMLTGCVVAGATCAVWIEAQRNSPYAKKVRQAEARVGLDAVFSHAHVMREKSGTFVISDIGQLGYARDGQSFRYSIWYAVNGVPNALPLPPGGSYQAGPCNLTTPPISVIVAASPAGFTAAAKGNLDHDPLCDEWSINDARVLTNIVHDVTH